MMASSASEHAVGLVGKHLRPGTALDEVSLSNTVLLLT